MARRAWRAACTFGATAWQLRRAGTVSGRRDGALGGGAGQGRARRVPALEESARNPALKEQEGLRAPRRPGTPAQRGSARRASCCACGASAEQVRSCARPAGRRASAPRHAGGAARRRLGRRHAAGHGSAGGQSRRHRCKRYGVRRAARIGPSAQTPRHRTGSRGATPPPLLRNHAPWARQQAAVLESAQNLRRFWPPEPAARACRCPRSRLARLSACTPRFMCSVRRSPRGGS